MPKVLIDREEAAKVAENWKPAHIYSGVEDDSLATAIRALPSAIPEGWQLVPKEPPYAMQAAARDAWNRYDAAHQGQFVYRTEAFTEMYRASLAAAPTYDGGSLQPARVRPFCTNYPGCGCVETCELNNPKTSDGGSPGPVPLTAKNSCSSDPKGTSPSLREGPSPEQKVSDAIEVVEKAIELANLRAAAEKMAEALRWSLPLADMALEAHRQERLRYGHSFGTKRVGLYDNEVEEQERHHAALAAYDSALTAPERTDR